MVPDRPQTISRKGRQRLVDQIEKQAASLSSLEPRSSLQRCASAGKWACLFVAAAAWRSRRHSLRMAGSFCALMAGVATLLLIAGGIFVVRLSHSPIVIEGLGPRIAEALDEKFGRGFHFSLGQTAITKRGYGPTLGIDGLSLKGRDGQTIFSAPYAEVSVDPFSLIIGRVTPKRLEVVGVEIKLSVLPNGGLTVSAGSTEGQTFVVPPQPQQNAIADEVPPNEQAASEQAASEDDPALKPKIPRAIIIKQAAAAMRLMIDTLTNPDSSIAAIDHAGIVRGRLVVDDRTTEQETIFNNVDLAFDKEGGTTDFHLSTDGPNGRWTASVKASGAPGSERRLDIGFDNLSQGEITLASGIRNLGVDFDTPISTQLSVVLTPEGTISRGAGQFKMNAGYFRFDDPDDEPRLIDSAGGHFHWDPALRRILIDDARLKMGGSQFAIAGTVTLPVFEGDAFALNFSLSEPGIYGVERPGEKPITIQRGDFAGRFLAKNKSFLIDRLSLAGANFGFALEGDFDWRKGPHLRLGASLDRAPVRTVARLWPSLIAAPVRAWFLEHFKGGTIEAGTLRVDFDEAALKDMRAERPPPDDASSIDFKVANGSVNFLPGVPPLHDLTGVAHITGRTTTFTISNGVLDTDSGRKLSVTEGSFHIPDARIKPTPAIVIAKADGPVEAVHDLLSYDAFKTYASMPVDSVMHGQIDGRLEVDLKIGPAGSPPIEPLILINATASNLVVEKLIGKEKLDAATLVVNVDGTGLKATGQGRMFGVPATLDISKPMGAKTADASLSFTIDDAARAKMGMAAVPGISGSVGTHINAVLGASDKQKAQIELDLTKTVLDNVLPGVSKPSGVPAKASFSITASDDATQIDQIALDLGPVQVRGSVELGSDQSLVAAKFSQVRLSPGDDMKIDISKAGDSLKMMVKASTIDARPFLRPFSFQPAGAQAGGSAAAAPASNSKESALFKNVDIDVKCGLLTGSNKKTMSNVDLHFVKQGDALRQFSLSSHFGHELVSGTMAPGTSRLNIMSEDAGSLLAFIDLYHHMEGGTLAAVLQLGSNENLDGQLEIKDFILRDEPAMRRLVAAGNQQAAPDPMHTARIDADSVSFKKLQVQFQRSGSRLELRQGLMYGTQIGLTVEGSFDLPHDKVALNGTFVPAYELNNLFSKIPLFGVLLGGGANEGLFAINYHITGSATSPVLNINPLSAMPSAVLRNIFGTIDLSNPNGQQSQQSPAGQ